MFVCSNRFHLYRFLFFHSNLYPFFVGIFFLSLSSVNKTNEWTYYSNRNANLCILIVMMMMMMVWLITTNIIIMMMAVGFFLDYLAKTFEVFSWNSKKNIWSKIILEIPHSSSYKMNKLINQENFHLWKWKKLKF
mgnify:CR=1 FL=1